MVRRKRPQQVGIETARAKLGEFVDRARFAEELTVITRNGVPAAAIVPLTYLEGDDDGTD